MDELENLYLIQSQKLMNWWTKIEKFHLRIISCDFKI